MTWTSWLLPIFLVLIAASGISFMGRGISVIDSQWTTRRQGHGASAAVIAGALMVIAAVAGLLLIGGYL